MQYYQLVHHTKIIIDHINFLTGLCDHHEIVESTIKVLLSYPLEWRTEIYEELVNSFATDEEWYQVIETLRFWSYYENVIFETPQPYTTAG